MANTIYKSVSSISFPTAKHPNRDVYFKQYVSNLEQGFSVNTVNALYNVRDTKINGYSSFYLSDKDLLTNFVSVTSHNTDVKTITTYLKFNTPSPRYFYVHKTNALSAVRDAKALGIVSETGGVYANSYKFELEIINDKLLRIKHNDSLADYYLFYNWEAGKFFFYQRKSEDVVTEERPDTFRYSLDSDGFLQIYGVVNNRLHVLALNDDLSSVSFVPYTSGTGLTNTYNTINIQYNFNTFENQINNSFINYDTSKLNTLSFNLEKSDFEGKSQVLLHTAYNTISSDVVIINFANLNTNRTEYGYVRRGSNLFTSNGVTPSYDYRDYKSIYTGTDQEGGSDNIILNYTFYDKDIIVNQDTTTVFKTPQSLYPYDILNINNSSLVDNGAFGAPSPILADKVYIKRDNNEYYNNGRYLCTWLSATKADTPGVWVDRYYYPDKISKETALSADGKYTPSFYDSVDVISDFVGVTDQQLVNEKFFDKKSDVAFVPDSTVKYERVGNRAIRNIVTTAAPLISAFENYYTARTTTTGEYRNICNSNSTDAFTYDGTKYHKLNVYQSINAKKAFTLSFDAYIDANKQYGFQILGNNTNAGFGVFQDLTVTPFLHVAFKNFLYIFNTDARLLSKVEFDSNIKDVFKRTAIDDYIVTCTGNKIYKVNALGNKLKLETENLIYGYVGYLMEENNINFLLSDGKIYSLDINTLEVKQVTAREFPMYEGIISNYTGLIRYNNDLYYLPSNNIKYEDNNTVFYTLSNYVIKHRLGLNPITFCKSSHIINDITILDNNVFIGCNNKIHEFTTTGIQLNTFNLNETPLLSGGSVLTLDVVNEYISGINRKYVNALCITQAGSLVLQRNVTNAISGPLSNDTILEGLSSQSISLDVANTGVMSLTKLTNYNRIKQIYNSTSLDFRLTLQNYLNSEDKITKTISFDTNTLEPGYHTFTYRYDSIQGNASLYVDSTLYNNQTFQPGKYYIQDTFNDELYIGSAGFFNGLDLAEHLKQPNYYFVKDLTFKNFYVYDRALSTTEIYALDLVDTKINSLVISLPCGQRNNKEEVERFFKFGRYNSSKSVDIIIKNLNTTDEDIQASIRNSILSEVKQILPVGVTVNNIKFVNYL